MHVVTNPFLARNTVILMNPRTYEDCLRMPIVEYEPSTHLDCPFNFFDEYTHWFEFHKRIYFDKQTRWAAALAMGLSRKYLERFERIMFRTMLDPKPF